MRGFIGLAAALALLGGCQTAFVGQAPSGRYGLVSIDGRPPPQVRNAGTQCPIAVQGGSFDLDSVARRFALRLTQSAPCARFAELVESGSYLRRGGILTLESEQPSPRTWTAVESGDSIALEWQGMRLRFRRIPPPR